ncbi:MAG: hypothetical protein CL969_02835 [Euryarchaeota archaeon]|jgi:hypothetical protein|nr:hypothetical protein [Euryarchaeota archaeon]|tara:strand:- start:365 stop:580 length:216 start_codon:yes stop_codon:yes gene_type:complete
MFDDSSDELVFGLWPFLKRILFLLIPFWVFLICWSANLSYFVSSIVAGLSVATIVFYEKYKLKQISANEDD